MSSSKYKFKRNVTGILDRPGRKLAPISSFVRFKSVCFEVSRRTNAKARAFKEAGITPNFHSAVFSKEQSSLLVVCNSVYKLLAFAKPDDTAFLEFIDEAEYAKPFKISGYDVLDRETLETSLENADMSLLDDSEVSQLKYWKCKTVGEVLYNWFD